MKNMTRDRLIGGHSEGIEFAIPTSGGGGTLLSTMGNVKETAPEHPTPIGRSYHTLQNILEGQE